MMYVILIALVGGVLLVITAMHGWKLGVECFNI